MNENELIPFCMKKHIDQFYNDLCRVLTDWENGEISDSELYSFMADVADKIPSLSYDS